MRIFSPPQKWKIQYEGWHKVFSWYITDMFIHVPLENLNISRFNFMFLQTSISKNQ